MYFTRAFIMLFLTLGFFRSSAQLERGIWYQDVDQAPIFDWQAAWIWLPTSDTADAMLARRSFYLEEVPDSAVLSITASTQYQLYVNGQFIKRGPARCASHHQSYDRFRLGDLMTAGRNTVAIRVHHLRGRQSYHHLGRAGLLAELKMFFGQQTVSIATDELWRVWSDPAWNRTAPAISRFQLFVNDRMDLRKSIQDWRQTNYDDEHWKPARKLYREVGWPSHQKNQAAQALIPPWTTLAPRDLPYLSDSVVSPGSIVGVYSLLEMESSSDALLQHSLNLSQGRDVDREEIFKAQQVAEQALADTVEQGQIRVLIFDFGRLIKGFPMLEISGTVGQRVDIMSAPFMINNSFNYRLVDSEFRDQIILSGSKDIWEATYFKPIRYLALAYDGPQEKLLIHRVAIRSIQYPFKHLGDMHSTDAAWVKQYFDATKKTILACTTDALTDNYRERRQYAQTGYYGAMGNYWTFGDYHLQRRYLLQTAQEQQANGIMPAYAPLAADDFMVILDSNCLWIRSLRNYLLYSGDEKTVRQLLGPAKKLMSLLHGYTNALGFIYNPPYAYWLDHAVIDRRGANLCLNGHYLGALDDMADMMTWLEEEQIGVYRDRAQRLRDNLRQFFWNDQKKLFSDAWLGGAQSEQFSEHGNAMALATGIATQSQANAIASQIFLDDTLNYIKRWNGMTMVTPALSYFLHQGLCDYGYIDESLALFRKRFDKMLAPNTNGTLWEEWWLDHTGRSGRRQKKSRSDAQTESAFPPALFGSYIFGIQPTQPGWEEVAISFPTSSISEAKGRIPTPRGMITISLTKSDQRHIVAIETPPDVGITIDLSEQMINRSSGLIHNGQPIDWHALDQIKMNGGRHTLELRHSK